ncbi:MAG: rhodanese-like domain-containing protein [Desulfamplus sp.]|nr:rhodanese-like domain-containing protein [Desulfamplus sp.]
MKIKNISNRFYHNPFRKTLWQVPLIILLAFTISIIINHLRSDKIPLIGNWSVDARFADSDGKTLVISLEQAKELFENNAAIFIDARPKEQYEEGHIQDALSLPWQEVDTYFMEVAPILEERLSKIAKVNSDNGENKNISNAIITYCDGESCELSHELALFLKEMGFNNVHIIVNGWTVWHKAGLPVSVEKK